MYSIIFYASLIILCSSFVQSQESCRTLQNQTGTCVPINFCKPILDLIESLPTPIPPLIQNLLQKSFCGVRDDEHYVCCSNMFTTTATPPTTPFTTATTSISSITIRTKLTEDVPEFGNIPDILNHPNLNLLPVNCGFISTNKISNGNATSLNELPFMALLQYEASYGLEFKCGGTIINQRYILTAAHCVTGPAARVVSVRVGEHVISTSSDCHIILGEEICAPPVEDIEVEEIKYNPRYYQTDFRNDIALIRLRRNINLENSNMKPICLPINNETLHIPLIYLLTAGWGYTEANKKSDILLQALLPVVERDSCQKKYTTFTIFESHICAGGVNNVDTCIGDSGGPAFFPGPVHNAQRYIQFGVVTAGFSLCGGDGNYPGLYTRISHHMKWILDELKP